VRWSAAWALEKIGDRRAVPALIAALQGADDNLRSSAARGLGRIGDPRAVEPLVVALSDVDSHVRRDAAAALGLIGDPRAVKPLEALLTVGSPERLLADGLNGVREAATKALQSLQSKQG